MELSDLEIDTCREIFRRVHNETLAPTGFYWRVIYPEEISSTTIDVLPLDPPAFMFGATGAPALYGYRNIYCDQQGLWDCEWKETRCSARAT